MLWVDPFGEVLSPAMLLGVIISNPVGAAIVGVGLVGGAVVAGGVYAYKYLTGSETDSNNQKNSASSPVSGTKTSVTNQACPVPGGAGGGDDGGDGEDEYKNIGNLKKGRGAKPPRGSHQTRRTVRDVKSENFKRFIRDNSSLPQTGWQKVMETWLTPDEPL